MTHELNNVLAIIEQTGGLLDDLCAGVEYGRPLSINKLREISDKVVRQVERGTGIIKRLNYFAHSVDESFKTLELNFLLANLVELCQRFVFFKKVKLAGNYPAETISLYSNPFAVQQAIFIGIRLAFGAAEKDDEISVALTSSVGGAEILINCPELYDDEAEVQERIDLLKEIFTQIQGEVELYSSGERSTLALRMSNFKEEASP